MRIFRANHVRWSFARTVRCGTQQDVALRTCGVRLICPALRFFKIHPAVSIRMRVREKLHENIRLLLLLRRKCRCFLRSRNKQIYRCDRLIRVPDATKRYPPFRKWRIPFCFGLHIIGTEILSQFRQVCKWQNRNLQPARQELHHFGRFLFLCRVNLLQNSLMDT